MGITGIYKLIDKLANVSKKTCFASYKGKAIAFDTNALLYRYLYSGQQHSHLVQLGHLVCDLTEQKINGVFVFDGTAPKQKAALKETREKRKREHLEKVQQLSEQLLTKKQHIEDQGIKVCDRSPPKEIGDTLMKEMEEYKQLSEKLDEVKKSTIHVSREQIQDAKELLRKIGQIVIEAHSEGEGTCAVMNRLGQVYAVIAEDADVIAFGGVRLIRGMGGYGKSEDGVSRRDQNMIEYSIPGILQGWKLTPKEFVDVSILCKCDFTSKIRDIGCNKALEAIKKHHSIENFLLKEYLNPTKPKKKGNVLLTIEEVKKENISKIPEDFDPNSAREVFYSYLDVNSPYEYTEKVEVIPYDHIQLCSFLKPRMKQWQEMAVLWTERIFGECPGYYAEMELFDPSFSLPKCTPTKLVDSNFLNECPFYEPSSILVTEQQIEDQPVDDLFSF